jgi:hypothetical protein
MSDEVKAPEEVNAQVTDAIDTSDVPVPETPEETEPQEESVPLEEAESKTGIKEDGINQDAVDMASKEAEGKEPVPEEEQTQALPSFFVDEEDRLKVEVDILFDKSNGNLVSVSRKGLLDEEDFDMLGYASEWFEFKPTNYEDMTNYRQRCSVFRRDAGRALVDPIALRNYLVVWHLKDWSMKDRQGEKVELKFNKEEALDDDSIKQVYKMNPTLLDVVLTLFEKDMMM